MSSHFAWYPSSDAVTIPWVIYFTNFRMLDTPSLAKRIKLTSLPHVFLQRMVLTFNLVKLSDWNFLHKDT